MEDKKREMEAELDVSIFVLNSAFISMCMYMQVRDRHVQELQREIYVKDELIATKDQEIEMKDARIQHLLGQVRSLEYNTNTDHIIIHHYR